MRNPTLALLLAVASLPSLLCHALPAVKQLEYPQTDSAEMAALLNPNSLSQSSLSYLKIQQWERDYWRDPEQLVERLRSLAQSDPSPALQQALIELCMDLGGRYAPSDTPAAVGYYLAAADAAFDAGDQSARLSALKPELIEAYNHSAGQVLKLLFDADPERHGSIAIKGPWKTYQLEIQTTGDNIIDPAFFDRLVPANYLKLQHTDVRHIQRQGIGAAMVGYREPNPENLQSNPFLSPLGMALPVNATLVYEARSERVELALHDLTRTDVTLLAERPVPLAADLTAPLVMIYSKLDEPMIAWKGMLHPEAYMEHMRIIQTAPFDPDKIPVIFTHGLLSSPKIWLPALNELNSDPLLRRHFQLFAFIYPTGFPIGYSAAIMRAQLREFQASFNPDGAHRAMQNMLLVGHSMGGILSNMQIRSTGNALESAFLTVPIDELNGVDSEQKAALRKLLIYSANPAITRSVFVASPHRGSGDATGLRGSIGSALIDDPTETVLSGPLSQVEGLTEEGRQVASQRLNGIESLEPYSPSLMALLEQPVRDGVALHSIIGRKGTSKPLADSSDGTVAYWSSHLDAVASEKVVHAKHTPLATHPDTIEELRRILYLHAALPYTPRSKAGSDTITPSNPR